MDTATATAAAAAATSSATPYGLIPLWVNGNIVSRATLSVLVIMSLGSWFIMFTKLWDQRAMKRSGKIVEKQFWTAPSLKDGVERLKKGDEYRFIAESGLRAASHHEGRLTDRIDLHEWITMALQRAVDAVNTQVSGGLTFLATVGSVAPFVGLFGTVMGILNALIAIGIAGQASIDRVLLRTIHRAAHGRNGEIRTLRARLGPALNDCDAGIILTALAACATVIFGFVF